MIGIPDMCGEPMKFEVLIAVGILFLAGLLLDKIGRIVHVPRVYPC
jgi:hypothetical protein